MIIRSESLYDLDRPLRVTTAAATCGLDNGTITISFPDHPDRTGIRFSLDDQATYEATVQDNTGSVTYSGRAAGHVPYLVTMGR